jgi:flavorubredoxin
MAQLVEAAVRGDSQGPNMVVIYDTQFGNTRGIAQAIVRGLGNFGTARILSVRTSHLSDLVGLDLLVAGAPTQHHGLTAAMSFFLTEIPRHSARGLWAAAFDTRYKMPQGMSGSAARSIAKGLRKGG